MTEPSPAAIPAAYDPSPDLLSGRVILVTGASGGLGRAVALECATHGATVALLGRKPERLEPTYDAITAAGAPEPALIPLDLASATDAQFEALAQVLRRDLGRLDGIAHCASHFVPLGPLSGQSLETWLGLLRVNLAAAFALTRACLPLLSASPEASVVFAGETHGAKPAAFWGGFAVAKGALPALARIWSEEFERRGTPRFNVLVPGPLATPMRALSHPGEDRSRLPGPESAARAFLYLLGPDGRALSGRSVEL